METHPALVGEPDDPGQRATSDPARAHGQERRWDGTNADSEAAALELFRLAIGSRDQAAWDALISRFGGQVRAWVRQHPCWPVLRHQWDDDQWVILAFERFWQAMRADRLAHFPTLASLLAYLKMCVHSALVDEARSLRASRSEALPKEGYDGGRDETTDVGALALERLAARELWHAIAETLSPDEQLVIVLSFAAGHKPREIARRHADRFVSVAQVYYLKRNALDRLRRNSLLLAGRPASRPAQQGAPAVCRPGARPTHAPSPACAYRAPLRRVA